MIILGILVWKLGFLHGIVTSLFWPLTLGSSESKAVIFLILMGSLLLINSLISSTKINNHKFNMQDTYSSKKYLKYTIILILITFTIGLICEVLLRLKFGVSIFTVFVSLNPNITSTSIIHTHIFKSVLGYTFTTILGVVVPSHVHTGESLFKYISPLAYVIFLTLPLIYVTSLISMDNRIDLYKLIIAFAATLALIGIVDGGIFSNPAIIGLAGLIGMYFIEKPFSPRNLIKPSIIILIIILAGLGLEIGGSNPDYHQITVIHPAQPVNMSNYDILSIENNNDKSIIDIKSTINDKETLLNLYQTFQGKADGFFMTWNFYSYF
jgi:hypothetical protein